MLTTTPDTRGHVVTTSTRHQLLASLALTVLLGLSACGDDAGGDSGRSTNAEPPSSSTEGGPSEAANGSSQTGAGSNGSNVGEPEPDRPGPNLPAFGDTPDADLGEKARQSQQRLLDDLAAASRQGGRLVARPDALALTLPPGQSIRRSIEITNEGDVTVTLERVRSLVDTPGFQISRTGCADGTILEPDAACTLTATYDAPGREAALAIKSQLLVRSDAERGQLLELPVQIQVKAEPKPEPEPESEEPAAEPAPTPQTRTPTPVVRPQEPPRASDADIMAARQQRLSSGFARVSRGQESGGASLAKQDYKVQTLRQRNAYPSDAFPGVDATLPVDRSRILTQDRVIKAVLERPVTNVMCNRVVAQVESDVYAPEGRYVLIPAGSRVVGTCSGFTEARAMLVWQRIIAPNGVSVRIDGLSADAGGRMGIPGDLDKRWIDRYGIPLLFSGINSAATYFLGEDEEVVTQEGGQVTRENKASNRALEQFQGDARQLLQNLQTDLQETRELLHIPAGTRLDIVPARDLYFTDSRKVVVLPDGDRFSLEGHDRHVHGMARANQNDPERADRTVEIDGKLYRLVPEQPTGMRYLPQNQGRGAVAPVGGTNSGNRQ